MRTNAIKANWTLDELDWNGPLVPGQLTEWDGQTQWCLDHLRCTRSCAPWTRRYGSGRELRGWPLPSRRPAARLRAAAYDESDQAETASNFGGEAPCSGVAGLSITVRAGSPILARPWLLIVVLAGWLAVLPASPPLVDGWLALLLSQGARNRRTVPARICDPHVANIWQTVGQKP